MNYSFSETTLNSFCQWLDNQLLSQGQAFYQTTSQFLYQPDPTLGTGYVAYAAPIKSLVWDSGIPGAIVLNSISGYLYPPSVLANFTGSPPYSSVIFPQISASGDPSQPLQITFADNCYISIISGIAGISGQSVFFPDTISQTGVIRISGSGQGTYEDITFGVDRTPSSILQGQEGMFIDYVNSRVILPGQFGTGLTISGSYSFKELNIYTANQSQEKMVFTNKYYLNSRFDRTAQTNTPPPYAMVTPCIFVTNISNENQPWAFGGVYKTVFNITVNILAENLSQLEGVLSILEDSKQRYFPQLSPADWPLNSFGTFKNGTGYSYNTMISQNGQPGNLYTIEDVKTSKVGDGVKINQSIFVGMADFTISKPRNIR